MNRKNYIFTSESVCSGHPDKICDQISDAIVDEVLRNDPKGKVAVETLVTENQVILAGEVNTKGKINFEKLAREQIQRLGYTIPELRFTYKSKLINLIHEQSAEIAVGIDKSDDTTGAGDQGMMFGYACNETPELMPLPIALAHAFTKRIDEVREKKLLSYLRPDGKAQVTVEYKNKKAVNISAVVLAVPHEESVGLKEVKNDLYKIVIQYVLEKYGYKIQKKNVIINGTGIWHFSGPAADTGVTGRKIVVDTYGGYARVGGGAFSGKDPSKVDRSGAYAARYLAKNIVAHGLADRCEVGLAYFIGARKPLMEEIETFGTEKKSLNTIKVFASKLLDCSVQGILETLDLRRPIYLPSASYGHFGRKDFPWEKINT